MAWDGVEHRKHPTQCQTEVLEKLAELRKTQLEVQHLLTGNGAPERGFIVRVDRLEQAEQTRQKHILALWATTAGLFLKSLWSVLTKP